MAKYKSGGGFGPGSGLIQNGANLDNQFTVGKLGGQTLLFGTATSNGGVISTNPSQDGIVAFGTMTAPSKWSDGTTANGVDFWSLKSGKNAGGVREVVALQNRGSSFGDDVALGFAPASGTTYTGGTAASPCRIECIFLTPNIYQFRFKPGNTGGTATEVLRVDGATLQTTHFGGVLFPHVAAAKTSNYTLTKADYTARFDATGGAIDATLPDATTVSGEVFVVKRMNSGANAVTIKSAGGTVEGAAAATGVALTAQFQARACQSDGTNWHFIGGVG